MPSKGNHKESHYFTITIKDSYFFSNVVQYCEIWDGWLFQARVPASIWLVVSQLLFVLPLFSPPVSLPVVLLFLSLKSWSHFWHPSIHLTPLTPPGPWPPRRPTSVTCNPPLGIQVMGGGVKLLTAWSRCFYKWQRAVTLHRGRTLTLSMSPFLHNVFPLPWWCVFAHVACSLWCGRHRRAGGRWRWIVQLHAPGLPS